MVAISNHRSAMLTSEGADRYVMVRMELILRGLFIEDWNRNGRPEWMGYSKERLS